MPNGLIVHGVTLLVFFLFVIHLNYFDIPLG
jgi:hypothetical protein